MAKDVVGKISLLFFAIISLLWLDVGWALITGIFVALFVRHPYKNELRFITSKVLTLAIIGLGFSMDLYKVMAISLDGFYYTFIGLISTFLLSALLGQILKNTNNTSILLSAGTAICGGSAIAAVAPAIGARHEETAVALGVVFSLNALALLIFPALGHYVSLSEQQFGLWCALAIHDTSSVLGASMQFGQEALEIATTVKLCRALWILPMTIFLSAFYRKDKSTAKMPWFIVGFLLASIITTLLPELKAISDPLQLASKRIMVLTLFFIGTGLTKENLRAIGAKPLVEGILLWIIVSIVSLLAISAGLVGIS